MECPLGCFLSSDLLNIIHWIINRLCSRTESISRKNRVSTTPRPGTVCVCVHECNYLHGSDAWCCDLTLMCVCRCVCKCVCFLCLCWYRTLLQVKRVTLDVGV